MGAGDIIRLVLRGTGQTLITAGLVVLLFVVYEVYVTNFFAHQAQAKVHHALEQEWANGDNPILPLPNGGSSTIPLGTGIANIYIPRFGRDYAWTIVEGVNAGDLEKGPGHYPGTATPGKVGNFAVAGHRVGKGEPFLNLDKLRAGDPVIIETKTNWYVYRVKGKAGDITAKDADGIPGRQIVSPSDGQVVLPVPNDPGAKPTEKLMTMTTCTPKFTAAQRMIVYAKLQQTVPRNGSAKPPAITALYAQGSS
jgi:sortase A